jgi:NitT/TauT family transport system substrate-binding protein
MRIDAGLPTNRYSRRGFLSGAGALSAASIIGSLGASVAEAPPEVSRIRLAHAPIICLAPQYLAEELLRAEGFEQVDYVEAGVGLASDYIEDLSDITMGDAPSTVYNLDRGRPFIALAGIHAGCFELFGNEGVKAIRDLKGKRVAVGEIGGSDYVFIASIVAYVGIDPAKDLDWTVAGADAMRFFVDGKADAFMGLAPQPHELRAQKVGHVIVNTAQDRPWSQYFCCMLQARRDFVQQYPVATKRALRAILKAADLCAQEPERAARYLVAKGYEPRYEVALEVLKELPYRRWREASPEDTLRFYALRLHESRLIKTNPAQLVAQGSDWRYLTELKRELKT